MSASRRPGTLEAKPMAQAAVLYRVYDLPWAGSDEQEERFRKIVRRTLGTVVALALLLSLLPVPEPDPAAIEEIPPRLARLVIEEPEPPPPVVPEPQELESAPEPEPVAEEPEPPPAEPAPEPVEPTPAEPSADRAVQARERARGAGLLPFAEQLAALRDEEVLDALGAAETETVRPGTGEAGPAVPERSLITSRAGRGSGGIDTAALSRDTGGGGLAGRATTEVASPVAALEPAGGGSVVQSGASDRASRSREEIERVFDRNKGAIYALYNRALRQNPALQGKLVLRLTIAPDGRVTACEVVSSELNDPELERRLVQRVMLFQFEAKDVAPVTTTKPIDFFPA